MSMQAGCATGAMQVFNNGGVPVKAIADLFSTDYGLFSISGIVFMIGMAIWFYRFFVRKMNEAERLNA